MHAPVKQDTIAWMQGLRFVAFRGGKRAAYATTSAEARSAGDTVCALVPHATRDDQLYVTLVRANPRRRNPAVTVNLPDDAHGYGAVVGKGLKHAARGIGKFIGGIRKGLKENPVNASIGNAHVGHTLLLKTDEYGYAAWYDTEIRGMPTVAVDGQMFFDSKALARNAAEYSGLVIGKSDHGTTAILLQRNPHRAHPDFKQGDWVCFASAPAGSYSARARKVRHIREIHGPAGGHGVWEVSFFDGAPDTYTSPAHRFRKCDAPARNPSRKRTR